MPVSSSTASIKIRVRVTRGEEDAFGPGKAQLLESLLGTGSLNRSASAMKMSYVKALALVRAMNVHFREPLVELSRGGKQGGGTQVTAAGRKVLADYQAMREASEVAAKPGWRRLRRLVKD
jgi:molybdate transport system regulatory protein